MSLEIQSERIDPDITVVRFSGSITVGRESQTMLPFVQDLLQKNEKKLILELSGIEHLDSSGVELLFECYSAAQSAAAQLRLASATPKVARLFRITRLDTIMPFHETVAEAVAALRTPSVPSAR